MNLSCLIFRGGEMIQQHKLVLRTPISVFHKFLNKDKVVGGVGVWSVLLCLLLNRKSDSKVHGGSKSFNNSLEIFKIKK